MPDIADVRAQFPQYNDMSDTALADALHKKFYSDMPRAQFDSKIGLKTEAPAESSTLGDIAKSFGSGIVRGAAGIAGLPGDIAQLAGVKAPFATSELALKRLKEDYGVDLHKPEGMAGKFAQTIGEFAPGMLVPGGAGAGIARRAATNVVLPALASETAGQLTAGTAAEPYARIAGGLAGGLGGTRALTPKAAGPTLEQIGAEADRLYKSPAITEARFDPAAVKNISNQGIAALRRERFNDTTSPKTFGILEDLKTPVGPVEGMGLPGAPFNPPVKASIALGTGAPMHTYEDFQAARTQLGKLAGNFNDPIEQAAASRTIKHLDQSLEALPQSALRVGNAQAMNEALTQARAEYAVKMVAGRVAEKLAGAEVKAGAAYSGGNINNATRQALKPLLLTKKGQRGFTEEEVDAIADAVKGSLIGNLARMGGKALGGGGGVGGFATAMGGMYASGGNPMGLALPIAGYGLKKVGDFLTKRKADAIIDLIKQRSPLYQRSQPPTQRSNTLGRAGILGLLAAPQAQQ